MAGRFSPLAKPQGTWWSPLGRDERLWVAIAAIWGLGMFLMIAFIWPAIGNEQNEIQSYRIDPAEFHRLTMEFTEAHQIGEMDGVPVVAPPPGSDIYLEGQQFAWRPVVQLKRGKQYRFLISSRDVQHGFSLVMERHSINFQVLPGFVTAIRLTPEQVGEFAVVCNEFCGAGHHLMTGRIIVTD